jgi:predicted DNA-binding transcriptional regulator YafY
LTIWNSRSLAACCELRNDFRNFRLDRARELVTLDQTFEEEPGKGRFVIC